MIVWRGMLVAVLWFMRTAMTALLMAATVGLGACASTTESQLRNEVFFDLYWTASKQCEARYTTLHVDRIGVDGTLSVSAAANSRVEAQPFRECYWKTVGERAEKWQAAGRAIPEGTNLHPDIDID
jgi:hypothetical protein